MSNSKPGRLGFGVIGAGRVGPVIAAALSGAGHQLVGITLQESDDADRLQSLIPGYIQLEPQQLIERSELVILAVPDAVLPKLVADFAEKRFWQAGQLVLNLSANHSLAVLAPAVAQGAIPLVLHPAMTFSGTSLDLARLRDSWCAVLAPTPVLPIAQALAVELGAEPFVISEENRPSYAEAIETANQFSAALVNQAMGLLKAAGVAEPGRVLEQVFRSAVDNALGKVVRDSQEYYGFIDSPFEPDA